MIIRCATNADIPAMHRIRLSVGENSLADPARVTKQSYVPHVAAGGAWVAEVARIIRGFAIVDAADRSVWALFVDRGAEGSGIGNALHEQLISWSRDQCLDHLSLTTAPGTRAEHFYRARGWTETGTAANGDLRFERDL